MDNNCVCCKNYRSKVEFVVDVLSLSSPSSAPSTPVYHHDKALSERSQDLPPEIHNIKLGTTTQDQTSLAEEIRA